MNHLSLTRQRLIEDREGLAEKEWALTSLSQQPVAVTLARIAVASQKALAGIDKPPAGNDGLRDGWNTGTDAYVMVREALNDLIYLAAERHGIERRDLPSTEDVADMLAVLS